MQLYSQAVFIFLACGLKLPGPEMLKSSCRSECLFSYFLNCCQRTGCFSSTSFKTCQIQLSFPSDIPAHLWLLCMFSFVAFRHKHVSISAKSSYLPMVKTSCHFIQWNKETEWNKCSWGKEWQNQRAQITLQKYDIEWQQVKISWIKFYLVLPIIRLQ